MSTPSHSILPPTSAGLTVPLLLGAALSLLGAWVVYRYVPETVERKPGARSSRKREG